MSLQSQRLGPVPEETARVAHAAYPKGNVYLVLTRKSGEGKLGTVDPIQEGKDRGKGSANLYERI